MYARDKRRIICAIDHNKSDLILIFKLLSNLGVKGVLQSVLGMAATLGYARAATDTALLWAQASPHKVLLKHFCNNF